MFNPIYGGVDISQERTWLKRVFYEWQFSLFITRRIFNIE